MVSNSSREINRGRELFFNFSRGCANYSKFADARNYSRAQNIGVISVKKIVKVVTTPIGKLYFKLVTLTCSNTTVLCAFLEFF